MCFVFKSSESILSDCSFYFCVIYSFLAILSFIIKFLNKDKEGAYGIIRTPLFLYLETPQIVWGFSRGLCR